MKNLFKEAHQMTREIKVKYPEVDYQAQFGLCLSYLHENKEEKEMELPKLVGSEKQVNWANDIRQELINGTNKQIENFETRHNKLPKSVSLRKHVERIPEYRQRLENIIQNKEDARWWIDHKDDGFYGLIRY